LNNFKNLLKDFCRAFYAPVSLYRDIHNGRPSPSWICVLIYCLIYVGGALWLFFNDFKPFVKPWITLNPDIYYLAESIYLTPLIFLMWILGAGIIHVVSKLFGGQGRFDTTFTMTGYSLWAPWYPLIIVDSIHSTPEWLYNTVLSICIILILVGTTISTRIEEKINILGAAFTTIIALGAIGVITFTFIR
jgi:hypothetical protein